MFSLNSRERESLINRIQTYRRIGKFLNSRLSMYAHQDINVTEENQLRIYTTTDPLIFFLLNHVSIAMTMLLSFIQISLDIFDG
jgi:hypothetical protein